MAIAPEHLLVITWAGTTAIISLVYAFHTKLFKVDDKLFRINMAITKRDVLKRVGEQFRNLERKDDIEESQEILDKANDDLKYVQDAEENLANAKKFTAYGVGLWIGGGILITLSLPFGDVMYVFAIYPYLLAFLYSIMSWNNSKSSYDVYMEMAVDNAIEDRHTFESIDARISNLEKHYKEE